MFDIIPVLIVVGAFTGFFGFIFAPQLKAGANHVLALYEANQKANKALDEAINIDTLSRLEDIGQRIKKLPSSRETDLIKADFALALIPAQQNYFSVRELRQNKHLVWLRRRSIKACRDAERVCQSTLVIKSLIDELDQKTDHILFPPEELAALENSSQTKKEE